MQCILVGRELVGPAPTLPHFQRLSIFPTGFPAGMKTEGGRLGSNDRLFADD
jgi:hypothetical protein